MRCALVLKTCPDPCAAGTAQIDRDECTRHAAHPCCPFMACTFFFELSRAYGTTYLEFADWWHHTADGWEFKSAQRQGSSPRRQLVSSWFCCCCPCFCKGHKNLQIPGVQGPLLRHCSTLEHMSEHSTMMGAHKGADNVWWHWPEGRIDAVEYCLCLQMACRN